MTTAPQDFLLLRAGARFRLGSGISVEREREIWTSLLDFLQANELLVRSIPALELPDLEGVELRSSDVSPLGLAVMKCGLDKWLKGIDRGKVAADVMVLSKCLQKCRA